MRLILILLATLALPVWAMDTPTSPARSLVDCDDLSRGALDAQARYIQTYTPRVDPVKTFDDATGACLEFISNFSTGFSFTIPSLGDIDALLRNMASKLLLRACQGATAQFSKAVNDASQSVSGAVGQIPGVSGGISTAGTSGVTVRDDGGTTVRRAADGAVDRVINFLK